MPEETVLIHPTSVIENFLSFLRMVVFVNTCTNAINRFFIYMVSIRGKEVDINNCLPFTWHANRNAILCRRRCLYNVFHHGNNITHSR